jgi:hypothetical protein
METLAGSTATRRLGGRMDQLTEVSAIGGGSLPATPACQSVGEQRVSTTHCTIECEPGPLTIVDGDLDRASLPRLRAALDAADTTAGDVQLDLFAVEFADL